MREAILTAVSEGDLTAGEAVDVDKLARLFARAAECKGGDKFLPLVESRLF